MNSGNICLLSIIIKRETKLILLDDLILLGKLNFPIFFFNYVNNFLQKLIQQF